MRPPDSRAPQERSAGSLARRAVCLGVVACMLVVGRSGCADASSPREGRSFGRDDGGSTGRGLVLSSADAAAGYVLYSPLLSTDTYLVDRAGRVVHTWQSDRAPGASVYLLDNGHLLRCARQRDAPIFQAGGEGGRIQEFTWDGELVWDYTLASSKRVQHHDIEPLPNGHVLAIVWEHKSRLEAIEAGRRPELVPEQGLLPDCVLEVQPVPPTDGRIVWEWHAWDHLVQDHDPGAANYGSVSGHPELIDINGDHRPVRFTDEVIRRLKALGYLVGSPSAGSLEADLLHTNAIDYSPRLDQILLTVHRLNEIWIIDHSTSTREAAGHTGGCAGRGGDLLYRWGNPQTYGRGAADDQRLWGHHDGRWIPDGLPGEGNIMVFNNGYGRPGGDYSSVVEITPPRDRSGSYVRPAKSPFGPTRPTWTYPASGKGTFAADFLSGAHRVANGNTFICSGPTGRLFEVTPDGTVVWEYLNPFRGDAPNPAGDPRHSVFRASLIEADHPALAGRRLEPAEQSGG